MADGVRRMYFYEFQDESDRGEPLERSVADGRITSGGTHV
jgi:hypothetical protein